MLPALLTGVSRLRYLVLSRPGNGLPQVVLQVIESRRKVKMDISSFRILNIPG